MHRERLLLTPPQNRRNVLFLLLLLINYGALCAFLGRRRVEKHLLHLLMTRIGLFLQLAVLLHRSFLLRMQALLFQNVECLLLCKYLSPNVLVHVLLQPPEVGVDVVCSDYQPFRRLGFARYVFQYVCVAYERLRGYRKIIVCQFLLGKIVIADDCFGVCLSVRLDDS